MSNERLVNWLQSYSASSSYRAHHHTSLKTFFNKTSINLYNTKKKDETKFYFQPSKVARGIVLTFYFPRNL
jgi:hypothetical protein